MKKIAKTLAFGIIAVMLVCAMTAFVSAAESMVSRFDQFTTDQGNAWFEENVASEADYGKYSVEGDENTDVVMAYTTSTFKGYYYVRSALAVNAKVDGETFSEGAQIVYTLTEEEQVPAGTYRLFKINYRNANGGINTLTVVTDTDEYVFEFEGTGVNSGSVKDTSVIDLTKADIDGKVIPSEEIIVAFKVGFNLTEEIYHAGIFYYGFFQSKNEGNAYPGTYTPDPNWVEDYEVTNMVTDADATIAIITNTSQSSAQEEVIGDLAEWIVNNADSENILLAGQMGDLSRGDGNDTSLTYNQYWVDPYVPANVVKNARANPKIVEPIQNVAKALTKLSNAGIPYFTAAGPNDKMGGISHDTIIYDHVGTESNKVDLPYVGDYGSDSAYTFKVGRQTYMVVSISSLPDAKTISWASKIIEDNKDKKVILVVGHFADANGTLYDWVDFDAGDSHATTIPGTSTPKYSAEAAASRGFAYTSYVNTNIINFKPSYSGNTLFNKLVAKNENVVLILDGGSVRVPGSTTLKSANKIVTKTLENAYGEPVQLVQANFADMLGTKAGAMLLAKVHDGGNKISFYVYSPQKGAYLSEELGGGYTFELYKGDTTGRLVKTSYNANDIDLSLNKLTFDANQYKWMSALTLSNLKYKAGEKEIEIKGPGYTINFTGANITYPGINGYYTFLASINGTEVYDKNYDTIKDLAGTSLVKTITFAQEGAFPFTGAKLVLDVGKALNHRTLTLVRYNETTGELEKLEEAVVSGSIVTFTNVGGQLAILK